MLNLFLYFFSFLFGQLGFLLGNITKEEHNEISKFVDYCVNILIIIFYGFMLYLFSYNFIILNIYIILLISHIIILYKNKNSLEEIFNVFLLSISFILLFITSKNIYFIILLIFVLFLKNSFKKYNKKKEIKLFIIYLTILIIYFLFDYLLGNIL